MHRRGPAKSRVNVGRTVETGAILGVLTILLAATGLLLSPSASDLIGYSAVQAGGGNVLYSVHLAAAALLVVFTLLHLWPLVYAFARKAGLSLVGHAMSYLLVVLVIVEIVTGYVLWFHDYRVLPKATAVQLHLATTFVILLPLSVHAWRGIRVGLARRHARRRALAAADAAGKGAVARTNREEVTRRAFLRMGAYALAGFALAAALSRYVTGQLSAWRLNYIGETPVIPKDAWRLRVTGLVENPIEITYDELKALGPRTLKMTHHCVEGWTYTDTFTGVPLRRVLEKAGIKDGARMLIFKSPEVSTTPSTRGQKYTTNFPYEDGLHDDVLRVYEVAGEDLPRLHGGPVRLMTPRKWGYKACKWLTEVEVSADTRYRGYWERLGYHNDGDYPGPIFEGRA